MLFTLKPPSSRLTSPGLMWDAKKDKSKKFFPSILLFIDKSQPNKYNIVLKGKAIKLIEGYETRNLGLKP